MGVFKIDHAGAGEILKSDDVARAVNDVAEQVAKNVGAQHLTVKSATPTMGTDVTAVVEAYTTDRAAAGVTIAHPAGLALQAKHGVLTKAAAQAGLDVKAKGD